jgi:hypothetical protein
MAATVAVLTLAPWCATAAVTVVFFTPRGTPVTVAVLVLVAFLTLAPWCSTASITVLSFNPVGLTVRVAVLALAP